MMRYMYIFILLDVYCKLKNQHSAGIDLPSFKQCNISLLLPEISRGKLSVSGKNTEMRVCMCVQSPYREEALQSPSREEAS